jgi:hypothetical protein
LKDAHIKTLIETILKQQDFCIKYDIDEVKAQLLAEYYIEDNIPQFKNILMFGKVMEEFDHRYMPNIIDDSHEDRKPLFKSSFCYEVTRPDLVPTDLWKY